ncbi:MAG: deoxyribose-phosphate aldolase [Thermodesulfobacteriota bacterium]
MDTRKLARAIDSTLLRADATVEDMERLAVEAAKWGFAAVCVPPSHIGLCLRLLEGTGVRVATVAGFPLGYQAPGVKLIEALKAFGEGATEIDMVMNVSLFKSGMRSLAADEIRSVVEAIPDAVVKVIIEAALLTDAEKADACEMAVSAGAHFVKTSTGFGPGGASVQDVRLLHGAARGRVKVKAAGGIRTLGQTLAMIEAGAARVGTSSAGKIMEELAAKKP